MPRFSINILFSISKELSISYKVDRGRELKTQELSCDIQCFRQKIDKTRIDRYEEEFAQYEKDLAAEKKKRGIN